jgi:hypothetical protein
LFTLFQRQVSHDRIEIDRMSAAAEGIVTVKVDMLPSDRRGFFAKMQKRTWESDRHGFAYFAETSPFATLRPTFMVKEDLA